MSIIHTRLIKGFSGWKLARWRAEGTANWRRLIPNRCQVETSQLVFRASGVVIRQLQITLDMRLPHA
jgi:hypothetical protein